MNWRYVLAGTAGAAGVAGLFLLPKLAKAESKSTPDEDEEEDEEEEAEEAADSADLEGPPSLGDSRWGKGVPKDFQKLATQIHNVAKIPNFWALLTIIANRESQFIATAHNDDQSEIDASGLGITRGLQRGNDSPKFVDEIKGFGSGGLFGALASSFAWIGIDKPYTPFLLRKPETMFEPEASAVFAAHYFYRVTSPGYANGRKLTMFDVRTGWASPDVLKNDPTGKTAQAVRGRMLEDIQELGWDPKWVESLTVSRSSYPGIKVVAKHFGYKDDQED